MFLSPGGGPIFFPMFCGHFGSGKPLNDAKKSIFMIFGLQNFTKVQISILKRNPRAPKPVSPYRSIYGGHFASGKTSGNGRGSELWAVLVVFLEHPPSPLPIQKVHRILLRYHYLIRLILLFD